MTNTSRTPAQVTRITRARSEAKAGGGRITTRTLPNGLVRVTDSTDGQTIVMDLDRDGDYVAIPAAKTAKTAKVAKVRKATSKSVPSGSDVYALVATALLARLGPDVRQAVLGHLTPQELQVVTDAQKRVADLRAA